MAFQAGSFHYIAFFKTGATGLITSDFTVDIFTKDGIAVDSNTFSSLAVVETGGGYYYAKYLPSSSGFYFLGLSNVSHAINVVDAEDIQEAEAVVNLTQNTGGPNALKPKKLKEILSEYILMVFESADWQVGRTQNLYAVAMTKLDSVGNWLTTPLTISPGTYHIIIRNNFGSTITIKTFLHLEV